MLGSKSEHSKPYTFLKALIIGSQNHIGFAMFGASGEECYSLIMYFCPEVVHSSKTTYTMSKNTIETCSEHPRSCSNLKVDPSSDTHRFQIFSAQPGWHLRPQPYYIAKAQPIATPARALPECHVTVTEALRSCLHHPGPPCKAPLATRTGTCVVLGGVCAAIASARTA